MFGVKCSKMADNNGCRSVGFADDDLKFVALVASSLPQQINKAPSGDS